MGKPEPWVSRELHFSDFEPSFCSRKGLGPPSEEAGLRRPPTWNQGQRSLLCSIQHSNYLHPLSLSRRRKRHFRHGQAE